LVQVRSGIASGTIANEAILKLSKKKEKKEEEIKNSLHRYRRRNNEPYQRFFAPVIDKRALHLSNLICHYPWIMIRLSYQTKSTRRNITFKIVLTA